MACLVIPLQPWLLPIGKQYPIHVQQSLSQCARKFGWWKNHFMHQTLSYTYLSSHNNICNEALDDFIHVFEKCKVASRYYNWIQCHMSNVQQRHVKCNCTLFDGLWTWGGSDQLGTSDKMKFYGMDIIDHCLGCILFYIMTFWPQVWCPIHWARSL